MRISVTDRCNLRCRYCMPAEGVESIPMSDLLTYEEIAEVCQIAAELGVKKLRLTGGEPLVRAQLPGLVRMLREIPGIESISMTTNGILLPRFLPELIDAGLDGVNISLDTLDQELFRRITRFDCLDQVLEGIRLALTSGLNVKVNTVLLPRDFFPDVTVDWRDMLSLAQNQPVDLRFIELMPIGEGKEYYHVTGEEVCQELDWMYPEMQEDTAVHGNGPAVYYRIPGFIGSVGLIRAIHGKFCNKCNRIRLSATGKLKPCLCYAQTLDLLPILRGNNDRDKVRDMIRQAILEKPAAHCFETLQDISEEHRMVSIGG